VPVLAPPPPASREVTFTVTDPATGETTVLTGSYLVQPSGRG
jgi:hypothetical protein